MAMRRKVATDRQRQSKADRELPSPWWGVLILLLLVGAVVFGAYGTYWMWQRTAPPEVTVPKVSGMRREAAEATLRRLGLVPRIAGERHSETVGRDVVIEIRPKADRVVKQGRAVDLLISLGSAYTKVPDLHKLSESEARRALREADLVVSKHTESYHSKVKQGYIIAQQPGSDTRVPRGSGVQVRVSTGPAPRSIPDRASPGDGESISEPRYLRVEAITPSDGHDHRVRIVVWDEGGERVAYDRVRSPGETVRRRVRGVGLVTVQVFVDDELVEQKTL